VIAEMEKLTSCSYTAASLSWIGLEYAEVDWLGLG
jgi:hypothetical protein